MKDRYLGKEKTWQTSYPQVNLWIQNHEHGCLVQDSFCVMMVDVTCVNLLSREVIFVVLLLIKKTKSSNSLIAIPLLWYIA